MCSFKDLQNLSYNFHQYKSCLFFITLNNDIVEIEKPGGIYLVTIVVKDFSGLFLHPFLIKDPGYA